MCSNVQTSNSSQEAIEKLIKDGMQCPSKTKPIKYTVAKMKYHLQSCVEYCTFWQLTTKGRTPVQLTVRRRILRSCRSVGNSFFLPHSRKIRKTPLAPKECKLRSKTTIVHCLAPQKNRARNLCRSQASKTECSESGANCVRGSQAVQL